MHVGCRGALIALVVLIGTVSSQGQAPDGRVVEFDVGPERPPTFRTSVEAIAVDVFVTDESGMPVAGLTRDDFEIDENGKRRPITTFRAVDLPSDGIPSERPLAEEDVASNEGPEGRLYVFALAVADPCHAMRARAQVRMFLDRYFGPNDMAAVVNLGRGLATDGQDFTSNRRLLLSAIDRFSGGFGACGEQPSLLDGRILTQSLHAVVQLLGRMPGKHKSLLYFNDRPGYPWGDFIDYRGGTGSLAFGGGTGQSVLGPDTRMFDDAHATMTIATRSNVAIYPIDPRGLDPDLPPPAAPFGVVAAAPSGDGPQSTRLDGRLEPRPTINRALEERMDFRALAELTGGRALTNSNDITGAFSRIARDANTYYMLGFNSDYVKNDGRFVRLVVRVNRPGLIVRARSGYINETPAEQAAADKARVRRTPVAEALASPVASAGHPMRLTAAAYRNASGGADVVVAVETPIVRRDNRSRGDMREGSVEVQYIATDARRRIYPVLRHASRISMPTRVADVTGDRVRLLSHLELPSGRYQIRAAGGGERVGGGAVLDLEIPDYTDEPLMMSGLMLTSAGSQVLPTMMAVADRKKVKSRTCRENACVAPEVRDVPLESWSPTALAVSHPLRDALPGPPTTARAFRQSDTVTVFAEVYDNRRPRTIDVRVLLAASDRPPVLVRSETLSTATPPRASGGHGITVAVPLAEVSQGRYALRVEANTAGGPSAVRQIPFDVLP